MANEGIPEEQLPAAAQTTPTPTNEQLVDVVISVPMDQLEMTQTVLASLMEAVTEASSGAAEQSEVNETDAQAEADILGKEIEGLSQNRL